MRRDLSREIWCLWWSKTFGSGTTEEWLKYLYPHLSNDEVIKYSHAFRVDDPYPPYRQYIAVALRQAPAEVLEDYANPEATISNGGSSPIPWLLDLVHHEIVERFLLEQSQK
jgi:hypothetical protein